MTQEHLIKIINEIKELQITQEKFDSLYTTNRDGLPISEQVAKSCTLFDCDKNEMTYKRGNISASGIVLEFSHLQFPDINVTVGYDYLEKRLYNFVLASPRYTEYDWVGKKSIRQSSTKVRSDKELQRLFNRLKKRFECPIVS